MKKTIIFSLLSLFLLASCNTTNKKDLQTQLMENYNYRPLNVELHEFEDRYVAPIKSSFLILNCVETYQGTTISSTGSGFAYIEYSKDNYYVITNNHVAPTPTRKYFVVTYTGQIIPATLMGVGGDYLDVAILKVEGAKNCQVANINKDAIITTKDEVFTLGTPSSINLFGSISKGVISNPNRVIKESYVGDIMNEQHAIQIDVSINPGNSGGPLYNSNNEVIGINTFALVQDTDYEKLSGVNFSLPIHDVLCVADYVIDNYTNNFLRYKPFSFGNIKLIDIKDMSLGDKKKYGIPYSYLDGVFVKYSQEPSLPLNSVITKINDVIVKDSFDLRREILNVNRIKYEKIPTVKLTIKNLNNETLDIEVPLKK